MNELGADRSISALPKPLLLRVEGLTKDYEVPVSWFRTRRLRAVDDVHLAIQAGETLGIVGESGSGKTTLARLILQLERPTSGSFVLEGVDLAALDAAQLRAKRRSMQAIFQDPFSSLDPRMTVGEIVAEPLLNYGVLGRGEREGRVAEMLEMCGLDRRATRRYPHEFSGGQRQRIAIARALVLRPTFVVADEPVSSLDVSIAAQIINLLADLQRELRLTYLLISHDMAVIKALSDRVAVMYLGSVVEISPSHNLIEQPLHPYSAALVSAVPTMDDGGRHGSRFSSMATHLHRSTSRRAALPYPLLAARGP
jgi:ABC-type glutathione transport system ATPase component